MHRLLILLFLVQIPLHSLAQTITQAAIEGTWQVKKNLTPTLENPDAQYAELNDGFAKSTYTFTNDNKFVFTTKSKSALIGQLGNIFKNNHWIFDAEKNQIRVGYKADNYSNLIINVSIEGKNVYFAIEDTQIKLLMKRAK
jgi:hypothetical protein